MKPRPPIITPTPTQLNIVPPRPAEPPPPHEDVTGVAGLVIAVVALVGLILWLWFGGAQ